MTETAQAWAEPTLIDNLGGQTRRELRDWDAFKDAFDRSFGDPNKEAMAIRELEKLKQGTGPASKYASEFRRMIVGINWNEDTFIWRDNKGPNEEVKDGLINFPVQTTLDDLINLSICIDDRLYQRKMERQEDHHHWPNPRTQPPKPQALPAPTAPSNTPNTFAHSTPVPIHVDANCRGPPLAEEGRGEETSNSDTIAEKKDTRPATITSNHILAKELLTPRL
ncbi:hypothetical protein FRC01_008066 [Tulasnella sp. 417]|nr:hypothetical protein FRC01_008066 [Tulasnella sp. 417]